MGGSQAHYDLLIVGGGIAGSTLARSMALAGINVLVVEKDRAFDDRVRGEMLMPWGVAEARTLGIEALLREGCAVDIPTQISYDSGVANPPRDFPSTTPGGTGGLSFYHPRMQEVLLAEAAASGAEVWRGAAVKAVHPGPAVEISVGGEMVRVSARLIVGADGRYSQLATMLGFERSKDATELFIGGFQCSGRPPSPDALHFFLDAASGRGAILVRTGPDNHRAYILHHKDALPRRLSGERDYQVAMQHFREIGVPAEWLAQLTPHGIFTTFDGAHRWIEHPVRNGFVLIGDSAGASDPVWGNGLSRTLRDVRLLRDRLLGDSDWPRSADAYAAEHDEHFQRLRRGERLNAAIFFTMGAAGDALRERAYALMEAHPGLYPDLTGAGPTELSDETIAFFLPPERDGQASGV